MKKLIALAPVLAVLLSGCGLFHRDHGGRHHGGGFPPGNPPVVTDGVEVKGNEIRLQREFIYIQFDPTGKPVTVEWNLDPKDGYSFTARGIVIEGRLLDKIVGGDQPAVALDPRQQEIGGCKATNEARTTFACTVKPTRTGIYKYSIQVSKGKDVITLDPPIFIWK